jgi:endo-1,4-beta-xylanase
MRAWLALLGALSAALTVGCGSDNDQSPAIDPLDLSACSAYYGLTFDDGPNTTYTPQVKDALNSLGVNATFFMTGQNVTAEPELAKSVVDAGNWVGNHAYTHPHLPELSAAQVRDELTRSNRAIQDATGVRPQLVRPPYGEYNDETLRVFKALNLDNTLWTVDPKDWQDRPVSELVADAVKVQDGGIILLHDRLARTVSALPQIVHQLGRKGLCPGKLAVSPKPVEALPALPGHFFSVVAVKP